LVSSASMRGRSLRPLLGDEAPVDKLRSMLNDREEAYSVANFTVDTESRSHDQVAEAIVEAWLASGMAES